MSQKITCREAQAQLTQIKTLEVQLREIVRAASAGTLTFEERERASQEARKMKLTLEAKITALQEQVNPFEKLFSLKEQYQSQIRVLEKANILEEKEINGEKVKGVTDIEGNFQPLPTLKEVIQRLREKKELLEIKKTQGFGKIRLVPFCMSLEDLAEKHKQVLREKATAKKLFMARNDPNEKRVSMGLDFDNPMHITKEYKDADKEGRLVYYPVSLTPENHGGHAKKEILKQRRERDQSGWEITVLEESVNIPGEGKGKLINGRKQIETNKKPEEYMKLLQTPEYRGETGITPEENLIHAITELVEKSEVIDAWGDKDKTRYSNGNVCFNIGAYFPSRPSWDGCGAFPYSLFSDNTHQVCLCDRADNISERHFGFRSGVRV